MNRHVHRFSAAALALLLLLSGRPGLAEELPEPPAEEVRMEAPPAEPPADATPVETADETAATEPPLTPEPLTPEATAVPTSAPGTAPEATVPSAVATPVPTATRAPYVEVFASVEGIESPLLPGAEAALAFTAAYFEDGTRIAVSADGSESAGYSQLLAERCVEALWLTFDQTLTDLFIVPDGSLPKAAIVLPLDDDSAARFGLTWERDAKGRVEYVDAAGARYHAGTPYNAGRARLPDLRVKEGLAPGAYPVNAVLHWVDLGATRESTAPFSFQVRIDPAPVTPTLAPETTAEPENSPAVSPTPDASPTPSPSPSPDTTPELEDGVVLRPERIYTTQGTLLPGSAYNVQFGVELLENGAVRWRTNADGKPEARFAQALTAEIKQLWVELDPDSFWRIFTAADAEAPRAWVVETVAPDTAAAAGLQQDRKDGNLFWDDYNNAYRTGDTYNRGFASFYGLTLREDLDARVYTQAGTIHCLLSGESVPRVSPFSFEVVVGAPTPALNPGGGGGYGGGGYGGGTEAVATPAPAAKLIIERMRTIPELPKPGDTFDIALTLRNTSAKDKVQNIDLTFTTENNVIRPVSGLNRVHLPDIEAGQTLETVLSVTAGVEIASDLVHMDVTLDFEDKDAAAKQATQEVFLRMARVQRLELDAPVLPNDIPIAQESFTVKVNVINKGKNTLDNVTASIVSDNSSLMTGGSWYGGNLESGAQKTAELELIPTESGDYAATLEVSYEDALTGKPVTETQEIQFTAEEAESYDDYYDYYDDYAEDEGVESEPVAPTLQERLSALPPWATAALGGGVVLVIVLLASLVRRLRRKALEDDALD